MGTGTFFNTASLISNSPRFPLEVGAFSMENNGWIKIHRKSLESSVWTNPVVWFVWSWILLKANHEDSKIPFNRKDLTIQKGSFISGIRSAISQLPCVTYQNYRTAITYLKSTGRITIQSNNKFSIITVCKWKYYQDTNKLTNKRLTSHQQASNKPVTTDKNDKNVKNIYSTTLFNDIFNYYLLKVKTKEILTSGRKDKMVARLKIFTPDQIKKAIDNCFNNNFYTGNNDRGWKANFDYIFRSDEIMDNLLNLEDKKHPQDIEAKLKNLGYREGGKC